MNFKEHLFHLCHHKVVDLQQFEILGGYCRLKIRDSFVIVFLSLNFLVAKMFAMVIYLTHKSQKDFIHKRKKLIMEITKYYQMYIGNTIRQLQIVANIAMFGKLTLN